MDSDLMHLLHCLALLDVASLEKDVKKYFEHGLAASTGKTYQAGMNKFVHFD